MTKEIAGIQLAYVFQFQFKINNKEKRSESVVKYNSDNSQEFYVTH